MALHLFSTSVDKPREPPITKIILDVPEFNVSLADFPAVFNVVGVKDGVTKYDNIVALNINDAGKHEESITVEEGTNVTVTPLYSGANYQISEAAKTVQLSSGSDNKVIYTATYNNGIIRSSSVEATF